MISKNTYNYIFVYLEPVWIPVEWLAMMTTEFWLYMVLVYHQYNKILLFLPLSICCMCVCMCACAFFVWFSNLQFFWIRASGHWSFVFLSHRVIKKNKTIRFKNKKEKYLQCNNQCHFRPKFSVEPIQICAWWTENMSNC